MTNAKWTGVLPAATTQLKADESLDIPATVANAEMLIKAGVHGLIMLGTVGENCSLELAEKIEVLRATVAAVKGRVPVLTGVAEYTTALGKRFVAEAKRAGVDGLMVLPAMVYKSDTRETVAHFRTIAQSTDLPIMIYNNPVSYGVDIKPETFGELADLRNVVAIKESSENPRRITDIRNLHGNRFTLLCGVDDLFLESMVLGAEGWVSGLVNAFPEENRLVWDLAKAGRWDEARKIYAWYTPLLHLDTMTKLVQYIKLAAAERGFGTETCRAPRLRIVGAEREQIMDIIHKAIATRPAAVGATA